MYYHSTNRQMDWLTCNSTDFLTRQSTHAAPDTHTRAANHDQDLTNCNCCTQRSHHERRPAITNSAALCPHGRGVRPRVAPAHAPPWEIDSSNNRLAWPINGPSVGDPRALQPHSGLTLIKMNAGALAPSGECSSMLLATYRWLLWEQGGLLWWV